MMMKWMLLGDGEASKTRMTMKTRIRMMVTMKTRMTMTDNEILQENLASHSRARLLMGSKPTPKPALALNANHHHHHHHHHPCQIQICWQIFLAGFEIQTCGSLTMVQGQPTNFRCQRFVASPVYWHLRHKILSPFPGISSPYISLQIFGAKLKTIMI